MRDLCRPDLRMIGGVPETVSKPLCREDGPDAEDDMGRIPRYGTMA